MRKSLSLTMMLLLFLTAAFSQSRTLTGTVKDSKGTPIPFATIKERGTNNGVSADENGNFKLNLISGKALVITATGFITQEKAISDLNDFSITLSPDLQNLDDVIVTGVVGATSRKKMTVSVTKVNAAQLSNVPASSLSSALSGKVAGLKTKSYGGLPGESLDLLLRGDNNLNGASGPLILVDGIIMSGGIADINSDDVESIEVVKGAAASSLYGSNAGNGVISITTKRGGDGSLNIPRIAVRNELGLQQLTHYLEVPQSHAYSLASDWETYKGKYTKYDGVTYPSDYVGAGFHPSIAGNRKFDADHYLDNPFGVIRNQQAEFFGTGKNMTNFIAVQNRIEGGNWYLSFENNAQQGVVSHTDGYKRQNFRFNIDQQIKPWLKISATNLYVQRKTQTPGGGGGLFYAIARQERDVDFNATNPDGQPFYLRSNQFNAEATNPIYSLFNIKNNGKGRKWLGNYVANIKFSEAVNLNVSQTLEIENGSFSSAAPINFWKASGGTDETFGMAYTKGELYIYNAEKISKNTQATLNMGHTFGDLAIRGKLSYLYENAENKSNTTKSSQFNYQSIETFQNFNKIDEAKSYSDQIKSKNYFGILGLDWKEKYLLDAMGRRDGSSLFGEASRWNNYYRVSAAYRISEDLNINWIDELKVRAAIGTAGLRPGFNWQYETYTLDHGVASPDAAGNIKLKPSKTKETEVGLNFDFLRKFSFEATHSSSVTTDQFIRKPLVSFLNGGFVTQWVNAGTVESNTIEMTFGAKWIKTNDFTWNTDIVFARVRQKITELPIAPYLVTDDVIGDQSMVYIRENEVYGAMYGYRMVRTLAEMEKQLPKERTIADYTVNSEGYVILAKTTGATPVDNEGTPTEQAFRLKENGADWYGKIGDGNADFIMGITNSFNYNGIKLYVLLDWKQGGDVYNGKDQRLAFNLTAARMDMTNVPEGKKKAYDYWTLGMYDKNDPNAYWVEDASYLKLREVAIGYDIPVHLLSRITKGHIKTANIKVLGRNLLTFTNYSGYDPEVGSLRIPFDGIYANPNYRNFAASLSFQF